VAVRLLEPPDKLLPPYRIPLNVIYEDPWILVVDKPAGLVTHPVGDFCEGTLSNALQAYFDEQIGVPGLMRPGIVHRLDRMTSGLLVVAKEHRAHRLLSIDFQQGKLSKTYQALLEGVPSFQDRTITLPIGQRPGRNSVLMTAATSARNPRPAKTRIVVQRAEADRTLVQCRLYTGRNHQIRVHCAHIGHPVVGDEYYGPFGKIRRAPRFDGEPPGDNRHALHAASLGFLHPVLREWVEFHTEPPDDFFLVSSSDSRDVGQPEFRS